MSFKSENKEIFLNEVVFLKKISECVQGDIIVPDTKGDIASILHSTASAVITSKEISGGRATVSGTVYTTILYVPQDGGLDTLSNTMSFSHSVKTENDDNINLLADCKIKSVEQSLYNSRKMNIKTTLAINIEGTKKSAISVLSACSADSGKTEVCLAKIQTTPENVFSADIIPFRETLDLPTGYPNAENILMCKAEFTDRDYKLLSNKAVIRGNINISVLYKGEDGSVTKSDFIQPFTEITDAPGADENMNEDIHTSLCGFSASITANTEGNMRSFFVEGNVFVNIHCYREQTEDVIADMFCTNIPVEFISRTVPTGNSYSVNMVSQVRNIIRSGNVREIIDTVTYPVIQSCETDGNNVSVSGVVNTECLCKNIEGDFFELKASIPFSSSEKFFGKSPVADCEVLNCSTDTSGGDAEIRITVSTTVKSAYSDTISCITDISQSENAVSSEKPSLTIYCTRDGDTLWSIAKQYSVAIDNIRSANKISDTMTPGQKIIIPR